MTAGAFLVLTGTAASYVVVALLLVNQYLELRLPYVMWWIAGATALAGRSVIEMSVQGTSQGPGPEVFQSALLLAAAGLFLTGAAARDARARGVLLAGLLGVGVLVFAAVILIVAGWGDLRVAGAVTWLAAGAAFLLAAEAYRRTEDALDDAATRATFGGLFMVGATLIARPWIPPTPATDAGAQMLAALSLLGFSAGLQLRALQRAQWLTVLGQISMALQRMRRPGELLDEILPRVAALLHLRSGWVFLRHGETGAYDLAAWQQLPAPLECNDRAGMRGPCRCLELLQTNQLPQPVNIVHCVRLERAGLAGRHATVPLRTSSELVGVMNWVLPAGRLCTQRDLALLAAVGSEVGLALEKVQLLETVQDKERARGELIRKLLTAQEDERRRIARELHDEAGQALTALILASEHIRTLIAHGEPVGEDLHRLQALAERVLEEVRALIADLRPTILDDLGLSAALRWYVRRHVEPRGMEVALHLHLGDVRLDPLIETVVFRIAQEALWNVVTHAAATHVGVELARSEEWVRLRVCDNGRGFLGGARRQTAPLWSGLGLGGMRERAQLLGGTVRITSSPGAGVEILATLPLISPRSSP